MLVINNSYTKAPLTKNLKNKSFSQDAASTPTGVQYKTTVVLASKHLNCLIFYVIYTRYAELPWLNTNSLFSRYWHLLKNSEIAIVIVFYKKLFKWINTENTIYNPKTDVCFKTLFSKETICILATMGESDVKITTKRLWSKSILSARQLEYSNINK